jgi:ABC-type amino acid transport system permease subunit
MRPFGIRLFGVLGAVLLGGLAVMLQPNTTASSLFEKGGPISPKELIALALATSLATGAFVILVIRVGTRFKKDATEIQQTVAALVLTAVILGSVTLAMRWLFAV